jgi:hypothetical protein
MIRTRHHAAGKAIAFGCALLLAGIVAAEPSRSRPKKTPQELLSRAKTTQQNLPAAKQAELAAAGIQNWTPAGVHHQTPVFRKLTKGGLVTPARRLPTKNTDTMQYDNGLLTALPTSFGLVFGNRFSLGMGGVDLDTITLNSFSFFFLEDSLPDDSLFFMAADPIDATFIYARVSQNVTGLMNSGPSFSNPTLNVVPGTAINATLTATMFTDTFFLGAWCINSASSFPVNNEMIGLATAGPQIKGFVASSGIATTVSYLEDLGFNAILRANVTSPAIVPVELMSFDVEGGGSGAP